jgi:hypothetical protein
VLRILSARRDDAAQSDAGHNATLRAIERVFGDVATTDTPSRCYRRGRRAGGLKSIGVDALKPD